jgi:membrane protease YdiL (CAAX protease family)
MNYIHDFIAFLKRPTDYQFEISRLERWKLFGGLLLLEVAILFAIVMPIFYAVDWITPLREEAYFDDTTLLKAIFGFVLIVPFFEEFFFRLILRYSGLVEATISRATWDRIFPFLVYGFSIFFGLLHVSNYANNDVWFYVFAPFLVISQLTGGFVISYLRVRLSFWWGCLYHFSWNFIFLVLFSLVESLFAKPYIQHTDAYSLTIEEKPFFESDVPKLIKIDSQGGKLRKLNVDQYQLQSVLDTLYGKDKYYAESNYLKIAFDSEDGIDKIEFIDLVKKEYDIISLKTYKKIE